MRQYRGLRDGKWVYGWYYKHLPSEKSFIKYYESRMMVNEEVIPETVGQQTGLKDKNDKEIYEGDIVKHPARPEGSDITFTADEYYTVKYRNGCFVQQRPNGYKPYDAYEQIDWEWERLEIIGDIHTTPELLEKPK